MYVYGILGKKWIHSERITRLGPVDKKCFAVTSEVYNVQHTLTNCILGPQLKCVFWRKTKTAELMNGWVGSFSSVIFVFFAIFLRCCYFATTTCRYLSYWEKFSASTKNALLLSMIAVVGCAAGTWCDSNMPEHHYGRWKNWLLQAHVLFRVYKAVVKGRFCACILML